jgi:peroxiredoxin family protein
MQQKAAIKTSCKDDLNHKKDALKHLINCQVSSQLFYCSRSNARIELLESLAALGELLYPRKRDLFQNNVQQSSTDDDS